MGKSNTAGSAPRTLNNRALGVSPFGPALSDMTLREALGAASEHWAERPGEKVMTTMATKCVEALEEAGYGRAHVGLLEKRHAIKLLSMLRLGWSRRPALSPKSVADYYGAFRRMLSLCGRETKDWPRAPTPPRKTRDPLSEVDTWAIIGWLDGKGWGDTGDLGRLLLGTGLRINVEALAAANVKVTLETDFDVLHVTGKGGHERQIPVVLKEARAVLADAARLDGMRKVTYSGHLKRWRKAVISCGVQSRLATPHAVRHGYATEVLARSGGNLVMVQELLGHADPGTTARYLSVDLSAKAKALAGNPSGDASECASTDPSSPPSSSAAPLR
jgi:integrase